jgi:hypothetical protein
MNWQEVCEHPDLQNLPFKEVWIGDEEGYIQFYDKTGYLKQSGIAIGFPSKINL